MRPFPYRRSRRLLKRQRVILTVILTVAAGLIIWWLNDWQKIELPLIHTSADSSAEPKSSSPPAFNKSQYSVDTATSPWVVVNKGRILPADFVPDLVPVSVAARPNATAEERLVSRQMKTALGLLIEAAKNDGLGLILASGYRSYSTQAKIYNNFVSTIGRSATDRSSARPGHSEHQTGLAVDIGAANRRCEIKQCFGDMAEGRWLSANSYKYGFIIRYTSGKESLTGYEYEPWHIRYVGDDLARQIHERGQTLEQFFGLPAYSSYPTSPFRLTK